MRGAIKLRHKLPDLYEFGGAIQGPLNWISHVGQGGHINAMLNIPIVEGAFGIRMVGSYRASYGFTDSVIIPLSITSPLSAWPLNTAQQTILTSLRLLTAALPASSIMCLP